MHGYGRKSRIEAPQTDMSNAIDYFLIEPIRRKHMGLLKFRVSQVLHERTNGAFDEWYVKRERKRRPPKPLGKPQFVNADGIREVVGALDRDGCCILPRKLADADIAEMAAFAFSTPAMGAGDPKPVPIRPDAIPRNTARHVWEMNQLIRLPAVQRILLDPAFCQIAQDYLKAEPVLTSVSLWIDAPADKKYGAHQYHYDNDGPGFLKFFFYLTDVEADSGAHCYIKGTHGHRKPEPFRLSTIYEDDVLHRYYGADKEIMFAAPKGTIIAEDTAGFHRGSTVLRGYRLLLQVQFSVLDIPNAEDLDGSIRPVAIAGLPQELRRPLAKYFVAA
jgi:hypothetical protein